jgi:hypothetical protein
MINFLVWYLVTLTIKPVAIDNTIRIRHVSRRVLVSRR